MAVNIPRAVVGATVGVEEEFHILDAGTGTLVPAAPRLLRRDADAEAELKRTMIETATDVHTDLSALRTDLVARLPQ